MLRLTLLLTCCSALLLGGCGAAPAASGLAVPAGLSVPGFDLDAELARGQPLVLVWWTPWCASCAQEAPKLVRAAGELAGRYRFFGIVPGSERDAPAEDVARFERDFRLSYPTVRDPEAVLTRAFGVSGTPTILVLGPGRELLYRGNKAPDWSALP